MLIDTVHYLARCGLDSFLVKPGHDPQLAQQALHTFIVHYQQAYAKPARAATGGGLAGISDWPAPTRG